MVELVYAQQMHDPKQPIHNRMAIGFRRAMVVFSTLLWLTLSLAYWLRPDSWAVVTIWPVWIWLAPGVPPILLCFRRRARNRLPAAMLLLWAMFLMVHAEETHSLFSFNAIDSAEWTAAKGKHRALRVISLNCAGGDPLAMREVATYSPDIVLLQEAPVRAEVERYARELFGTEGCHVIAGIDASILSRGTVAALRRSERPSKSYTQVMIQFSEGIQISAISVRLDPFTFRDDVWSPECWRSYAENRLNHRGVMREISGQIQSLPDDMPVILGGDFNSPQDDAIFRELPPRLADSFSLAGSGWGNTISNEMPVLRIDQIWASRSLRPVAVVARQTKHSDHRMVISDFMLETLH